MSKIHTPAKMFATGLIAVGLFVILINTTQRAVLVTAELLPDSEQGAVLGTIDPEHVPEAGLQFESLGLQHASAAEPIAATGGASLAVGMLFVLIGFFCHAVIVLSKEPPKRSVLEKHKHGRQIDLFWAEVRR